MIDTIRFKDLFKVVSQKNTDPNVVLLAATQNRGIIPKTEVGYRTVTISEDNFEGLKLVKKGDFCITLRSFQGGIEYSEYDGGISSGYTVLRFKRKAFDRYFKYFLKNIEFVLTLNKYKVSIRDGQNIPFSDLGKESVLFLPYEQQTAIANYLDYHTSRIDKEISLLEQKVEKLDEYKQSLIYETVTKGLDKNVPMKDSGIEWIGMIPEYWEVKRVSDFFNSPKTITNPGRTDVLSLTLNGVIEKDIENNKGLNPESYDTYQIFKKNDLVFKLIDLANYQTSRVGRVWKDGIMSSAYIRLSKKKNTNIDYFFYQFFDLYKRAIFNMLGGNGVRSAINRGDLLKLSVLIPTKKEQQQIAEYLDEQYSKIDKKKELINKKIELLKEYKQSLIYEAVTGKINIGDLNV